MPGGRPTSRSLPLALALATVALHAPLITWGLPHATGPDRVKTFATDEILPLEGLAEMRSTFVSPAPDRNLAYPWWHYFVVAAAQAPYLALLAATGGLAAPSAEYPFGLADPVGSLEVLTIVGRLVSVAMSAGIVVAAYYFSAAAGGRLAGVLAALLTMVSYLMVYYGRIGNLDVPAFFWSAAGLAVLASIFARGLTARRAVWLGVLAACAGATKDQTILLFLPVLALLLPRVNHLPGARYQVRPLLVGAGAGLLTYLVATGMVVDPQRHLQHLYAQAIDPQSVTEGGVFFATEARDWEGARRLMVRSVGALGSMMSWPVLLTAIAGIAVAVRREQAALVWLLPFPTVFLVLVWVPGILLVRYLLPLTLFVDAFAAIALVRLRRSQPWAAGALFALLLIVRLVVAADLSYAQWHDTRYQAAAWLQAHLRPGDRIEYFGVTETLPPLPAGVDTRRVMGQEIESARDTASVLQYLRRQGPQYLIVIPDWTSRPGAPHSGDCPADVYTALVGGQAGYALKAYFPSPALAPGALGRPALDYPTVAPPVRIFARADSIPMPPPPH